MKKQTFSLELVKHLSELVNINLSDKHLKSLQQDLSGIEEHMESLKKLNLSSISETSRTNPEVNIFRDDTVLPSLSQKDALANATEKYKGFFMVNYLLENKDI